MVSSLGKQYLVSKICNTINILEFFSFHLYSKSKFLAIDRPYSEVYYHCPYIVPMSTRVVSCRNARTKATGGPWYIDAVFKLCIYGE